MGRSATVRPSMLRCEDCGLLAADEEHGWVAVVLERDSDTPEREVLIYCPDCAEQFEGEGTSLSPGNA
jgi:hypothetical protein